MITQAPKRASLLTLAAFAIACVGLVIWLWVSFGGPVPLAPVNYRLYIPFRNAAGLVDQADVRISGVNVGTVAGVTLDRAADRTVAEVEIFPQYAPRPAGTRAILRQKSALGEIYIELSPGNPAGPKLPDGATLPQGDVEQEVQFSDLLETFDPATRRALTTWLTQQGIALGDGGQALNDALYDLTPLSFHAGTLLAVLRDEEASSNALIARGGTVLAALSADPGALPALVRDSDTVFSALANRDTELARTVTTLPGFEASTDATLRDVGAFAAATTPAMLKLLPVARALGPVLERTEAVAPALRALMIGIGPLAKVSGSGNRALAQLLSALEPVLARAKPYLGGLVPVLGYLELYHREIAGFVANAAAATQATLPGDYPGPPLHYLRASVPINPEALAAYPYRLSSTRSNPYITPDSALSLKHGLPVFGTYLCTSHPDPTLSTLITPASLRQQIQDEFFTSNPAGPTCRGQEPLGAATTGETTDFPHLRALP